ncbi:glycosyltransferase family 2 protein [Microbacterium sp. E-13]|uniref:glycosyltransferase family 2 protein n=1 Tax=Microbacterium sp. E-13 TaxID=3404048 RepID=UPI003CE674DB
MTNLRAVVVVATYRRPDHVRTCLEHLTAQTVKPARTIVVDASPDDLTRQVVAGFEGVEYRRNDHGAGTLATSRAIGIEGVDADVVAYIDDDAYAFPEWLEELLRPYDDPTIGAVGGRALNGQPNEDREGLGQIGRLLPDGRLTGYFAADPGRVIETDHMLGANMSYRLEAARRVGGVHDFYPGTCLREDADMPLRLRRAGWRVVFAPRAVVRHVAGQYAKGVRFDSRYRYYGARNHVVLLATTLGHRDPVFRRYLATAMRTAGRDVRSGAVAAIRRPGWRAKLTGAGGGVRRAAIGIGGTAAGLVASVRAVRAQARAS